MPLLSLRESGRGARAASTSLARLGSDTGGPQPFRWRFSTAAGSSATRRPWRQHRELDVMARSCVACTGGGRSGSARGRDSLGSPVRAPGPFESPRVANRSSSALQRRQTAAPLIERTGSWARPGTDDDADAPSAIRAAAASWRATPFPGQAGPCRAGAACVAVAPRARTRPRFLKSLVGATVPRFEAWSRARPRWPVARSTGAQSCHLLAVDGRIALAPPSKNS
jgi:hypothetical protein